MSRYSEYYCLRCAAAQVSISPDTSTLHCLKCGSPEIAMRDNTTLTAAARRKGVTRQYLSRKILEYNLGKPQRDHIRHTPVGFRKLYKVSDIEFIWHHLGATP